MSLNQYSNTGDIINTNKPIVGNFYSATDRNLLEGEMVTVNFGTQENDLVEFHVYDEIGNIIKSNHVLDGWFLKKSTSNDPANIVSVDIHENIREFRLNSGKYRFILNFHRDIVGNVYGDKLYISKISDSRREIKLYGGSEIIRKQVQELELSNENFEFYEDFLINFGNNDLAKVTRIKIVGNEIICKLYNELPADINEKTLCWLTVDVRSPYIDNILLTTTLGDRIENTIAEPNFDINVMDNISVETNLKNWNDILSSNIITSQQLIDTYFSSSIEGIDLNIDYSSWENFIHFSSAEERVKNFKYKLGLVEYYENRIEILSQTTGSVQNNIIDSFSKRNNVIAGFDGFEKYLYYETGSKYTYVTGSIGQWPKKPNTTVAIWQQQFKVWNDINAITPVAGGTQYVQTPIPEYILYATSESIASDYYNALLVLAQDYDRENDHALVNTIPGSIYNDTSNSNYTLFVNMIGHHFDILWSYVKNLTSIYSREEHPDDGIPSDLIYDTTKAFGFELSSGNKLKDLWKYTLGTDNTGSLQQTGSMASKPHRDITKEIWRRILNNVPYLLRTKGTERSIRALMSCYGVPNTILRIVEYGGPKVANDIPKYIINKFNYATTFDSGSNQYILIPSQPNSTIPKTITFRFKQVEPEGTDWKEIMSIGSGFKFELQKTGSAADERGNVKFTSGSISCSINDERIFDGGFSSTMIRYTNSGSYPIDLFLKKSEYGKLVINSSASVDIDAGNWNFSGDITFGSKLTGSAQEFRLWKTTINENVFNNHVHSPESYNGNDPTSSYYDLLCRIPMIYGIDLSVTSSITSMHPDQSFIVTASFLNFTTASYEPIEEDHYIETVSIGGNNIYSDKIRIEDNYLVRTLDSKTRAEKSSYDLHPVDSNEIGIYFSPQDVINEDIFDHVGYTSLDNYIGDPDDVFNPSYEDLRLFSEEYWKKYTTKPNISDYLRAISIFDFSIFNQIKKLLPLRSKAMTGLLIEPNVLERSKVASRRPTVEDLTRSTIIDSNVLPELFSDYVYYTASLGPLVSKITGSCLDTIRYTCTVTSSKGINPAVYQYTNLIKNQDHVNGDGLAVFVTASNSRDQYNPFGTIVTGSRSSIMRYKENYFYSSSYSSSINEYYSSSRELAEVQDYNQLPIGLFRLFYSGCKLTGQAINIDSTETVDGGPVVEVINANPNQIILNQPGASGSLIVE